MSEMILALKEDASLVTVGDWIENEYIRVNGKKQKVHYSREAGDLYIMYGGKKYFLCEFD